MASGLETTFGFGTGEISLVVFGIRALKTGYLIGDTFACDFDFLVDDLTGSLFFDLPLGSSTISTSLFSTTFSTFGAYFLESALTFSFTRVSFLTGALATGATDLDRVSLFGYLASIFGF